MTTTEFNQGLPFHYTGKFHRLKSFTDQAGQIIADRAVELMKLAGKSVLLNVSTGDEWKLVGEPYNYTGCKNGQPLPAQTAVTIYRPEYGNILILLSDCTLIKTNV